jgi:DNA excision repair protein ERCC-3
MAPPADNALIVQSDSSVLLEVHAPRAGAAGPVLADRIDATHFRVRPAMRGVLRQALVAAGFPAEDLAG